MPSEEQRVSKMLPNKMQIGNHSQRALQRSSRFFKQAATVEPWRLNERPAYHQRFYGIVMSWLSTILNIIYNIKSQHAQPEPSRTTGWCRENIVKIGSLLTQWYSIENILDNLFHNPIELRKLLFLCVVEIWS